MWLKMPETGLYAVATIFLSAIGYQLSDRVPKDFWQNWVFTSRKKLYNVQNGLKHLKLNCNNAKSSNVIRLKL